MKYPASFSYLLLNASQKHELLAVLLSLKLTQNNGTCVIMTTLEIKNYFDKYPGTLPNIEFILVDIENTNILKCPNIFKILYLIHYSAKKYGETLYLNSPLIFTNSFELSSEIEKQGICLTKLYHGNDINTNCRLYDNELFYINKNSFHYINYIFNNIKYLLSTDDSLSHNIFFENMNLIEMYETIDMTEDQRNIYIKTYDILYEEFNLIESFTFYDCLREHFFFMIKDSLDIDNLSIYKIKNKKNIINSDISSSDISSSDISSSDISSSDICFICGNDISGNYLYGKDPCGNYVCGDICGNSICNNIEHDILCYKNKKVQTIKLDYKAIIAHEKVKDFINFIANLLFGINKAYLTILNIYINTKISIKINKTINKGIFKFKNILINNLCEGWENTFSDFFSICKSKNTIYTSFGDNIFYYYPSNNWLTHFIINKNIYLVNSFKKTMLDLEYNCENVSFLFNCPLYPNIIDSYIQNHTPIIKTKDIYTFSLKDELIIQNYLNYNSNENIKNDEIIEMYTCFINKISEYKCALFTTQNHMNLIIDCISLQVMPLVQENLDIMLNLTEGEHYTKYKSLEDAYIKINESDETVMCSSLKPLYGKNYSIVSTFKDFLNTFNI